MDNTQYPAVMEQAAPYPYVLAHILETTTYKPGWGFDLRTLDRGQGCVGLTLLICISGEDTNSAICGACNGDGCDYPGYPEVVQRVSCVNCNGKGWFHPKINVVHYFPVPPAAYNTQSWQRWLFEQILLVEQHEAAEFFRIGGKQPYAPNHSEGYDPYTIRELTTAEERSKTFRDK